MEYQDHYSCPQAGPGDHLCLFPAAIRLRGHRGRSPAGSSPGGHHLSCRCHHAQQQCAEDTASRPPCGHANLCGLSTAPRVSYCTAHHHACGLPYRSRIILADRASSCLTLECLKKELREPLTLASYRGILVPGSTWCPIVLPVPNCSSIVHQGRLVAHANEASNASENKPRNRKRK